MSSYLSRSRSNYTLTLILVISLFLSAFVFLNIVSLTPNHYMLSLKRNKTIIYIVTPTYARSTQMADMTRLSQTLRLVPDIHWVVVENEATVSDRITKLLNRSKVKYTLLAGPTPEDMKTKRRIGKGTASRRKALDWIRSNAEDGVLYFADDDNSYDIRVFEEMRSTVKVSVWPVGLLLKYGVSSPIVSNGKVIGFDDPWIVKRIFPLDMAGFAVSINIFKQNSNATMDYKIGYLEDSFLKSLHVTLEDLEPKANSCTEILVWHTKTKATTYPIYKHLEKEKNYTKTNLVQLYMNILDGKPR